MIAPHPLEFPLLQHPQERDLSFHRESPISSRKSVPPSAASNLPRRRCSAPVNAPFSCPKSSDAISDCGIAAQLTRTKALSARFDLRCSARAISSLPVPVSPRMRTVESDGATFSTCSAPGAWVCRHRRFPQTSKSDRFPRAERGSRSVVALPSSFVRRCRLT